MPSFSSLGKFFGRTASEGAAFAAGVAVAPALSPVVREIVNEANSKYATHPIDAETAAAIVAEDVDTYDFGRAEASFNGINEDRFKAILGETLNAPGIGELFEMWRRNLITDAQFTHGLRKAKLETLWDTPLEGLHDRLLSSEELAMMQQQGFVDAGRANAEGALQGVTEERQQLRFEASGLPPGIETALEMLRRSIIDAPTFAQIVREGHTKTKYTDDLLALQNRVLSESTYATLALKGWISTDEMHAGGALTGYTPEQMDLVYKAHGRPATTHQVFIGNIRGGHIGDPTTDIAPDFLQAVRQSDIRPEYAPVIWAARFTYPSAFVLRALTQSGEISESDAHQVLIFEGWEPTFAAKVAKAWATAKGAAAKEATATDLLTLWDGHKATAAATLTALEDLGYPADEAQRKMDVVEARRVAAATNTVIGDLHTEYKKGHLSDAAVLAALEALGLSADGAQRIVAAWAAYLTAAGIAPAA